MAKSYKLDKFEKDNLRELSKEFNATGGVVYAFPDRKITVALRPVTQGRNPRFFKVSIAYCSPADKFSKKRGAYESLLKNLNEEFVIVPGWGQDMFTVADKLSDFLC